VGLSLGREGVRVEEDSRTVAASGVVAAQIYQGGHVDLHVEVPKAASGRVLLRLPGRDAMSRWPAGTHIGIAIAVHEAVAFRRSAGDEAEDYDMEIEGMP